jgi:hypothetical protein
MNLTVALASSRWPGPTLATKPEPSLEARVRAMPKAKAGGHGAPVYYSWLT